MLNCFYEVLLIVVLSVNVECEEHAKENVGKWVVKGKGSVPCIKLNSEITLQLSYIKKYTEDSVEDIEIIVPVTATTDEGSSCEYEFIANGVTIPSQLMRLTFDSRDYPGWGVDLIFTKNNHFGANENEYVLFTAAIDANYSAMPDLFPDYEISQHNYTQPLENLDEPTELAMVLFSSNGYSFYCPSKQRFPINSDPLKGPTAWIQFRYTQFEAFMNSDTFSQKDTCPADQHTQDLLPIIVGCVLGGLVILTLAAYLIYRCRLPEDVINLTSPHSQLDELTAYDNKAVLRSESAEDEEITEQEIVNPHEKENGITRVIQRRELKRAAAANDENDLPL